MFDNDCFDDGNKISNIWKIIKLMLIVQLKEEIMWWRKKKRG